MNNRKNQIKRMQDAFHVEPMSQRNQQLLLRNAQEMGKSLLMMYAISMHTHGIVTNHQFEGIVKKIDKKYPNIGL